MAREKSAPEERASVARNKRARHDYELLDTYEAGIVLVGSEVKSLRDGKANLQDAYGIVKDGELWLLNCHIAPYSKTGYVVHEPTRTRKLLLHKAEIRRLIGSVERKGLTLVPLELYWRDGRAKIALALGRGKQLHDKRQSLKERDAQRDLARVTRQRGRL